MDTLARKGYAISPEQAIPKGTFGTLASKVLETELSDGGRGMVRSYRSFVAVLAVMMGLAACGTRVDKDAFYAQLAAQQQQTGGEGVVPGTPEGSVPGSTAGPSAPGSRPTVLGTRTAASDGSRPAAPISSGIPSNVSTTVVGNEIVVGLHVPVTGAAPLPTNWDDSLEVVQRSINDNPIHGRTVRFIVEDDGYDPARGLAACRKLADSNVLLVIGHSMPTIQESCASFFHQRGIPYLMRGIPEAALDGHPIAYFGTPSDDHQARLLADYAIQNLGARSKIAGVVTENDQPVSKREFTARLQARGGKVAVVENSSPRQSDFGPIIQKLQNANAQIVFLNIAPVDAIKIAVQSQSAGYHPTWIGEGTHWNYNLSMESAGAALDGAVVFSPWPSIDSAAANEYKAAFRKYLPKAEPDDIGLIIWGWGMLARQALLDAGPQLSRASLVGALNTFDFNVSYWNPVRYTATDHRGPRAVAVFRGDGQAKRWRQISGFRTSF